MTRRQVLGRGAAAMVAGLGAGAGILAGPRRAGAQRGARVGTAAPELTGGPWLNGPALTMAGLRGRVVYVEFWTHG